MVFSIFKKSLRSFHRRARSDESWLAQSRFPSLNNVVTRTYSLGDFQSALVEYSAHSVLAINTASAASSAASSSVSPSASRISSALDRITKLEVQLAEGENLKTQLELRKKQTTDAKDKFAALLASQKAETEQQRSRCEELQARIKSLEQKIRHMDRFYALLDELDPYIPGFTSSQHKPLWASKDEERIVDRIKVVSKRPDSLWKPIIDAIVGPIPSEEYMFQVNETLRLRKEGREYAKYAKFWERKARQVCHDVEFPCLDQLDEVDQTRVDDRGTVLDDMVGILKRGDDLKSRSGHRRVRFAELAVESASKATHPLLHGLIDIDDRDTTMLDDVVEALKRGEEPPRIGPNYHSTKPTTTTKLSKRREKPVQVESQHGSGDDILTFIGVDSIVSSPKVPCTSSSSSNSVSTGRPSIKVSERRNILSMLDTNLQVRSTKNSDPANIGGERVMSDLKNHSPPRHPSTRIPIFRSRKPLPLFTEPPNVNSAPSKALSLKNTTLCSASESTLDISLASQPASPHKSATVVTPLSKYTRTPKFPKPLHSEKPEVTMGKENVAVRESPLGLKSKTVLSKGRRLLQDFARSK